MSVSACTPDPAASQSDNKLNDGVEQEERAARALTPAVSVWTVFGHRAVLLSLGLCVNEHS